MRKFLAAITAISFAAALAAPLAAATTVKGQLVDEGCGLTTVAGSKDAKAAVPVDECALDCAKRGEPVALVTADGKVYRIAGGLAAEKNAKLIAHMGHTVEITGEVSEKDGKVLLAADVLKMVGK
jgi:hypothetical protein